MVDDGLAVLKKTVTPMNLDSSVGRARVSRWRRVRVGATTLRAHARKAEQRPRASCQWFNRVCSAVTQKVTGVEAEIVNVHKELVKKPSGQLRNLGSCCCLAMTSKQNRIAVRWMEAT
jgi:hypothetical protein